nr:hypothetical protein [Tanacetum cinerariifolium]
MGEGSHDSTLEQHEKQIEEILNHLDELPLDRIERIEDDVKGLASTMSQAAIRKLVADSIAVALEIQIATMAEADNPITKNSSAINLSTLMVRKELLDTSIGSRELNQYFLEATVLKRTKLHLLP